MKKIGIFYGSSTGYTANVANQIANGLGVELKDVFNVAKTAPSKLADYDMIILGSSTWGLGDLQDDWYDFIKGIEVLDLKGKTVALFGCGDETMSDTFCNAVATIAKTVKGTGADIVGSFDAKVYHFSKSEAVNHDDGMAVGLLLDEINHPELTESRIANWVEIIKKC